MKFAIDRNTLHAALQKVLGGVETKQTMQILGNVLLDAGTDRLTITGTDLELELVVTVEARVEAPNRTTVNARKLHDIVRSAPRDAVIECSLEEGWLNLRINRSRFKLATMDPQDFPQTPEPAEDARNYRLPESTLRQLIDRTAMSMAQQDVRYFLNGMLIELNRNSLRCVTTDGHRLAFSEASIDLDVDEASQFIVPRKAILELGRLLDEQSEQMLDVRIDRRQMQIAFSDLLFTTKLIDGRYPNYERVIPSEFEVSLNLDRLALKDALTRATILSQDKFPGARFTFGEDTLLIETHNNDQESSREELPIDYQGAVFHVGFNIRYLLDILNTISGETVMFHLRDSETSSLIQPTEDQRTTDRYVLMPMKL
ncbi:MAG: DNA polymerase III subunit beta [Halothiobacillaceae bacterium]